MNENRLICCRHKLNDLVHALPICNLNLAGCDGLIRVGHCPDKKYMQQSVKEPVCRARYKIGHIARQHSPDQAVNLAVFQGCLTIDHVKTVLHIKRIGIGVVRNTQLHSRITGVAQQTRQVLIRIDARKNVWWVQNPRCRRRFGCQH